MRIALVSAALLFAGCVIQAPPREPLPPPAPMPQAAPEEQAPATSVMEEPPAYQPDPVAVGWAPPPMLVEAPPPMPFMGAVWVGGYWVWRGDWVWASGHWMGPPQPSYLWVHPYYEHRGDAVIFIDGHWSPPGVVFVPPPPSFRVVLATPAFGVVVGPRPIGPEGCFVPAPPGSRRGIIVPAPIGTAPAVVTSAPPVVAVGMRVTTNVTNINNTRITNVTNVTNVTIVAPAAATASGRAFNGSVPAAPHLAAARPALVQARAPAPTSLHPVTPYTPPVAAGSNAARNMHQPSVAAEAAARNMPHQPSVAAEAAARGSVTNPGRPTSGYTPVAQTQNPVAPHTPAPGKPATGAGGSAYAPANSAKPAVAAHPNNVNANGAKPPKADGSKGHDPKKAEHGEEGQH